MSIIKIESLDHPGAAVYGSLTEAQLRNRLEPEKGIFIAESPKVINVAVGSGYEPLSLLCEERHITGDAASIIARFPDIPVYTASRELLASLTGYTLTRGVLAAMRRRPFLPWRAACGPAGWWSSTAWSTRPISALFSARPQRSGWTPCC